MNNVQDSPIGVFDSGVGGLTVLRELYQQLPRESIIYFADTARLPYGNRPETEILKFVREILIWMAQQNVKMVIMACNTSSALALETVRSEFSFPILGVILPGARAAVKTGQRIGVISTPATAKSGAYRQAIQEINPNAQVWEVGCPEFVPLIEQNRIYDPYTKQVTLRYVSPLLNRDIDTLIYGCTHYRHLAPIFHEILPPTINLIDPASFVIQSAEKELKLMGLYRNYSAHPTRFYVSGCPKTFSKISQQWLGYCPVVEPVSLPKIARSSWSWEETEILE